ncbi:hypothetical protein GGR50DRAFT_265955 [Xylaria sp. CBS 124048]|nr:hypothetical protein GGR50DRAFT_265955 [Xylaria sp. CBS 124048]
MSCHAMPCRAMPCMLFDFVSLGFCPHYMVYGLFWSKNDRMCQHTRHGTFHEVKCEKARLSVCFPLFPSHHRQRSGSPVSIMALSYIERRKRQPASQPDRQTDKQTNRQPERVSLKVYHAEPAHCLASLRPGTVCTFLPLQTSSRVASRGPEQSMSINYVSSH